MDTTPLSGVSGTEPWPPAGTESPAGTVSDRAPTGVGDPTQRRGDTVALKEWAAAIHGLLQGRQRILLRKGGIHEKSFIPPEAGGGFLLFPTVAHTHAHRTRPEHHDLLRSGAGDATDDTLIIRAAVRVVGVVAVSRPDRLAEIQDLHIWTDDSIRHDRVEFRPVKPLQVLIVQALALPQPLQLDRLAAYGGCRSWVDVATEWSGQGIPVVAEPDLRRDLARVQVTVGATC